MTANASQLKYVLQLGQRHDFYYIMIGLISTSIVLQVNMKSKLQLREADKQQTHDGVLDLNRILGLVSEHVARLPPSLGRVQKISRNFELHEYDRHFSHFSN